MKDDASSTQAGMKSKILERPLDRNMERAIEAPESAVSTNAGTSPQATNQRLKVLKTYKIYINGKFPRTESGRYFVFKSADGQEIANVSLSSRKDLRDAVSAARGAQTGWSATTAMIKGQILYRIAEMLEGRRSQFLEELRLEGYSDRQAEKELNLAIDRLVYYAGWADKYQQLFSTVNPVASSHFNFSVLESTGVVAILAPEECSLLGLVSVLAPAIVGGNAVVLLASQLRPLSAVTFSEVLHSSDVPGGVVNILTGNKSELFSHMTTHMDVNAALYCGEIEDEKKLLETNAALNVKRAITWKKDWTSDDAQNPYMILDLQEVKTTWHPVGI